MATQLELAKRRARAARPAAPGGTVVSPQQQDSYQYLTQLFESYGIGSLAPTILRLVQSGASEDTIVLQLKETPEYKQRFAGNDARRKKGLPELAPGEYIATERAYRQLMSSSGLPLGFYDSPSDFQSFIENDLSPTELQDRVSLASEAYFNSPETMKMWRDSGGTDGEFIAMALDQAKAAPLVRQRIRSLEAQAIGKAQGVGFSQADADVIGASGANLNEIRQGVSFIAQEAANAAKLGQIDGTEITTGDLTAETFLNDGAAAMKRQAAGRNETARFGGGSAVGQTTLSKSSSKSV